jgi:hypothetical protein
MKTYNVNQGWVFKGVAPYLYIMIKPGREMDALVETISP